MRDVLLAIASDVALILALAAAIFIFGCGMETNFPGALPDGDDGWLHGCDEDNDLYPDYADCLLI